MVQLKLGRLPERKPVKLSVQIMPELNDALNDYARIYADVYGAGVSVNELVPAMLSGFLESDREFAKVRASLRTAK